MARQGVLILLVLAGAVAAGENLKVNDPKHNFEIKGPTSSLDWESVKSGNPKLRAHFETVFHDVWPVSAAVVRLYVTGPGSTNDPKNWREQLEFEFAKVAERKEHEDKLGGIACRRFEVRGKGKEGLLHLTWRHLRYGSFVYVLDIRRYGEATEDDLVRDEIGEIVSSFRFLKQVETPPERDPELPDPEHTKRETIEWEWWRLKVVKPEGLLRVRDLDASERVNGVIGRFDGRLKVQQTLLMIRIYAHRRGVGPWKPLKETMRLRLSQWQDRVPEKQRKEPELEFDKWKPPRAKEMLRMKLLAFGKTRQTTRWYFAECSNGVQYEIEIYFTGTRGEELWRSRIDDFLKNFRPQPKKRR
jgi:hypothetical protein